MRRAKKLTRPTVGDHGRARPACRGSSRLAAFQLRLGPRLVLRGIAPRLHTRLALGGRSLAPRLCAGRRARGGWRRGDRRLGSTGGRLPALGAVGTFRRRWTLRMVRLVGTSAWLRLRRAVAVWPGPRPHLGRWIDARAAQIASTHADLAPPVVVRRTGAHAGDERVGGLTVFEDEARLGPEGPGEHHPCRAIRAIGVVVRIVVHHDPETHAGVVVRAPGGIVHVRVAVVAQEPWKVVVTLDVVLLGAKVHAHALSAGVRVVAPVGPDLDTRAVREGGGLERRAPDGADEQADQAERGQHECLRLRERSRRHAIRRLEVPSPNWLSMATLQRPLSGVTRPRLSSTRDNRPIISFREPHG